MTRHLHLDLIGGCAGDMLLAALIDAGASQPAIREAWNQVGLEHVELQVSERPSFGLRALGADVIVRGTLADSLAHHSFRSFRSRLDQAAHAHRSYAEIRGRLEQSALPPAIKALALTTFEHLANAEAHVHGVQPGDVHLHEVGADDAIADIVGCATAYVSLGAGEVSCSAVPLGRGVTTSAHGAIPLPGPATLELLEGMVVESVPLTGETVTPTGAALLRSFRAESGAMPRMTLDKVGVGAGRKVWPDRPNVVRALLGAPSTVGAAHVASDAVIEATIDDMSPEHVPALLDALLAAGAHDAWWVPAHMKKGRVGMVVSALVTRDLIDTLAQTFFLHSSTIGVRIHDVRRQKLERSTEVVATEFGEIRVKRSKRADSPDLCKPEHDDCARIARERNVPIREVFDAALRAAWKRQD